MKITIQYFDGCPHWKLADERVRHVLRGLPRRDVKLEYELIDSPEAAARARFRGSPTILIDGQDPFAGAGARSLGFPAAFTRRRRKRRALRARLSWRGCWPRLEGPTPRRRRTQWKSGADCAHRGLPGIHGTYVVNQNVPAVYEVAIQTGL